MGTLRRIYRNLYTHFPKSFQGWMSRLVLLSSNKPSVKSCCIPRKRRFPNNYKGALVISADFEMAWAWRYAKSKVDPEAMGLKERKNIPGLLELFEKYEIPITWATVGHLFLENCYKENGRAHDRMERIPYFSNKVWSYKSGDWYDHDPCSDWQKKPAWYAPDLIRLILESKIKHEIACHSFSHIDCSDKYCPENVMAHELKECVAMAYKSGLEMKSMVFPGGTNGNYKVLKKHGFTNYRIKAERDLFYPEKDTYGLWRLPSSASIENHGFGWSCEFYGDMYRKYIDKAIESGTVCHLWFHPNMDNFCINEILPRVLDYARSKHDQGELWICTMADMALFCEVAVR